MDFVVVLEPQFHKEVLNWPKDDQIALDGGLVRPLRKFGFEFILAARSSPTSVIAVEWVEPVESPPVWSWIYITLTGRVLRLRVDSDSPMRISRG